MFQDYSFKPEKWATVLSVPKRQQLSGAVESPGRPPPSPQLPHQLHGHMHWSPFFFPKSIKTGYFLCHNLKAAIFIWQNSLLVSIFNDNSRFWCTIRSAGGMLLIASTNDRDWMENDPKRTEKNPRLLDLVKTSTTIPPCNPKLRWIFNSSSITEGTFFLPSN